MPYPVATIGTIVVIVSAYLLYRLGALIADRTTRSPQARYRARDKVGVVITLPAILAVCVLWGRLFQQKGTFFGLLGAGLAVALREPLLSMAGRISIFAARMYSVGDRIEIEGMAGDVIHIGLFYTRMLEIGNWIHGDQASGRVTLFSNAQVYQHSIFNYTALFPFIWDEVMLPVTYASDVQAASDILLQAGYEITAEFQQQAKATAQRVAHAIYVPDLRFEPTIYTIVNSNYVSLTMRYVVDPKQRRGIHSALYQRAFGLVRQHPKITIASDTMDITLKNAADSKSA